jgi:hypothetical protein
LDCCHVCKTCAFHGILQAANIKKCTSPPYCLEMVPAGARSEE